MTVNDITRKLVREKAKFLCEYCHSLEASKREQLKYYINGTSKKDFSQFELTLAIRLGIHSQAGL